MTVVLFGGTTIVTGQVAVPTSIATKVQRRADPTESAAIPTLTFDAIDHYVYKRASDPLRSSSPVN
jgi:hypothetical protein